MTTTGNGDPAVRVRINHFAERATLVNGLYCLPSMSGALWWSADGTHWYASPEAAVMGGSR